MALKNDFNEFIFDNEILKNMAKNFFSSRYFNDSPASYLNTIMVFPALYRGDVEHLDASATEEEIKKVLWSMGPTKAPGPNGFPTAFYQNCWSTVKVSLMDWINLVLSGNKSVSSINNTLISLIPKVPHLEVLLQFRPIRLFNVNYKVLTKLLVQRIQPLMDKLIGEE